MCSAADRTDECIAHASAVVSGGSISRWYHRFVRKIPQQIPTDPLLSKTDGIMRCLSETRFCSSESGDLPPFGAALPVTGERRFQGRRIRFSKASSADGNAPTR
jgi:hypothetical protein